MNAVLFLLIGLGLLTLGAELLLRAATRIALRLGVSPMVIGLTVVAVGTSLPELAVGVDAVRVGAGSLAIGNVVGTNTANILLILGLIALIRPLKLERRTLRYDLPFMVAAALILALMMANGALSWLEGAILAVGAVAYTWFVVRVARREAERVAHLKGPRASVAKVPEAAMSDPQAEPPKRNLAVDLVMLAIGIGLTILGAGWFVDGAVSLATLLGVSEALIGLTVVAIGTSMPELVTSIVASIKGDRDVAVGNLIGSSVYNIALILGVTLLAAPGPVPVDREILIVDLPVMVGAVLLCVPVFFSNGRISRWEAGMFVTLYLGYLAFLIVTRT